MDKHGSHTIELAGNVIVVRFFSAWNKEASEAMCKDFIGVAKTIAHQPWSCLVDLTEWGLGGPDVWQPIVEVNRWCAMNNQKFEAVVCTQRIQEHILRSLQEEMPNTQSAFFAEESEALAWLATHGFSAQHNSKVT